MLVASNRFCDRRNRPSIRSPTAAVITRWDSATARPAGGPPLFSQFEIVAG
jgi:hypothetical protein